MPKHNRKRSKVNRQVAELLRVVRERAFLTLLGKPELNLQLAIFLAKTIDPLHWTVVVGTQVDRGQFPEVLQKQFPTKRTFILFPLESFLPPRFTPEDLTRIWLELDEFCSTPGITVIAIIDHLDTVSPQPASIH